MLIYLPVSGMICILSLVYRKKEVPEHPPRQVVYSETMVKNHDYYIRLHTGPQVEESRWEELDISPITSIGEAEIYFAINPARPDIKEALDSAMRRIKDDNPFYTDDLYRRYLSAQNSSFLSKEEREWIGQHGALRIGYLNSGWRYQQCRSINR